MRIKEIPKENRPREKAIRHGVEELNDEELLALIIGSGVKGSSALDIAHTLLSSYITLSSLANANISSLEEHLGISKNLSLRLLATFEFHNRLISPKYQRSVSIVSPQDIYQRYRYLENYEQEVFVIIMMNRNNKIIKEKILYKGTEEKIPIDPKEILREIIMSRCKKYALVHNHPSEETLPSNDDIYVTEVIEKNCHNMQIKFFDHVIIHRNGYYSFTENNIYIRKLLKNRNKLDDLFEKKEQKWRIFI